MVGATTSVAVAVGRDKKRKRREGGQNGQSRREDVVTMPGRPDLPRTWDRTVHRSGSCAVIVFVDQLSARNALKAVGKIRSAKDGREAKWRPEGMPKLGIERMSRASRFHRTSLDKSDAVSESIWHEWTLEAQSSV